MESVAGLAIRKVIRRPPGAAGRNVRAASRAALRVEATMTVAAAAGLVTARATRKRRGAVGKNVKGDRVVVRLADGTMTMIRGVRVEATAVRIRADGSAIRADTPKRHVVVGKIAKVVEDVHHADERMTTIRAVADVVRIRVDGLATLAVIPKPHAAVGKSAAGRVAVHRAGEMTTMIRAARAVAIGARVMDSVAGSAIPKDTRKRRVAAGKNVKVVAHRAGTTMTIAAGQAATPAEAATAGGSAIQKVMPKLRAGVGKNAGDTSRRHCCGRDYVFERHAGSNRLPRVHQSDNCALARVPTEIKGAQDQ